MRNTPFLLGRCITILIVICLAIPASAASPDKQATPTDKEATRPAWEWTLEERLAKRFDPLSITDRHVAHEKFNAECCHEYSHGPETNFIQGFRDPELFLPHEVFSALLTAFYPKDRELEARQREGYSEGMEEFGYDKQVFWSTLEKMAEPYLATQWKDHSGTHAHVQEALDRQCRALYDALQLARAEFPQFDRFLYTRIAPGSQRDGWNSAKDQAAQLRFEAGGCRH
jgi:hypothetical protein